MRIRTFCKFIEKSELHPLVLRDSTVVIDGQNFFYRLYEQSQFPSRLDCESHGCAKYLRYHLAMFKKANIKCYFIFKGGHQDMAKRLKKVRIGAIVSPAYVTIYMEVLKEMGFQYVICEYESKRDIIELAQTLDCPVITYDIELCFSGLQYIPQNELEFNEKDNTVGCRYFLLDKFLSKNKLTVEKLALFIVLTDENIFPQNFFLDFFKRIRTPLDFFHRNLRLLHWLSKNTKDTTLEIISQFINAEEKKKFMDEVAKAQLLIGRREKGGLGAACLLDPAAAVVAPGDPNWLAKGVASNNVPINYVNLYRSKHFYYGSIDGLLNVPIIPYLVIVKYAFDLLTNFQNDGFTIVYNTDSGRESMVASELYSIRKPEYEANVCVFENGWGSVRELGLFQHFLKETVQLTSLEPFAALPEDSRLLVAALVYFSRKTLADTSTEAACVLLSYVTLNIVLRKCDKNLPRFPFPSRPILDSTTDESIVTAKDCNIAAAILAEYLDVSEDTIADDLDEDVVHRLKQFQMCLRQLMDLNALCGVPLPPSLYSRVYSGALVARLRRGAGGGDEQPFLDQLLAPAPTVYALLNGLIEAYLTLI